MKKWPKNGETVRFSDLVAQVKRVILFAYKVERKNEGKPIPWKGYNIGEESLVSSLTPEEALTAKQLKYDLESQGRDALDVILGIGIQLGIEQGRRAFQKSPQFEMMMMKLDLISDLVKSK